MKRSRAFLIVGVLVAATLTTTPGASAASGSDGQHASTTPLCEARPTLCPDPTSRQNYDGDYVGQTPPRTEQLVHPLEHGRVDIWYRPSLPARQVSQLETLYTEPIVSGAAKGYKQLLVSRASMPFAVAATAWGQQLGCATFDDKVFDAIRAFRLAFVDHGPEQIPFPE